MSRSYVVSCGVFKKGLALPCAHVTSTGVTSLEAPVAGALNQKGRRRGWECPPDPAEIGIWGFRPDVILLVSAFGVASACRTNDQPPFCGPYAC